MGRAEGGLDLEEIAIDPPGPFRLERHAGQCASPGLGLAQAGARRRASPGGRARL